MVSNHLYDQGACHGTAATGYNTKYNVCRILHHFLLILDFSAGKVLGHLAAAGVAGAEKEYFGHFLDCLNFLYC